MSDIVDSILKNSKEPEWLEKNVAWNLRVWHIIFICFGGFITIVIILCCCIKFRIPRTKQQIEADYQRRKITSKFKKRLEKIQDAKMDTLSLKDALEMLYGEMKQETADIDRRSIRDDLSMLPVFSNQDMVNGKQKPEPQAKFAKIARDVANASIFVLPRTPTPTSPGPSGLNRFF